MVEKEELVRILVVDDEPLNADMVSLNLDPLKATIAVAHSGKDAVALCQNFEFAVILLDVNMPNMNGYELARRIRAIPHAAQTPIIFITGSETDIGSVLQGYDSGACDYMLKPIDMHILRAKTRVFLDLYRAKLSLKNEIDRRISAEEQRQSLEGFIEQLRNGEVDTLMGGNEGQKILRLLDQVVIDKNDRLLEELTVSNQQLAEREEALQEQKLSLQAANNKLQQQAEQLTRINKELDEFSHVASHDLRQPLRTLSGYCKLLREDLEADKREDIERDLQHIIRASERMTILVDDLLSFARSGREQFNEATIDLNKCLLVVREQLQHMIEQTNASILCEHRLPVVRGDMNQMVRVLQNVIHNSVKFRQNGVSPVVILSVEPSMLGQGFCRLTIADNGIGIKPQQMSEVFNPFERLHSADVYPGSGLGLAIVKKIVERHGGKITISANEPHGVKVSIDLPEVRVPAQQREQTSYFND